MFSRREFLARAGRFVAATGCGGLAAHCRRGIASASVDPRLEGILSTAPRARYWMPVDSGSKLVQCLLCAHRCSIPEGERGRCRARMNVGGELRSLVYGRPLAIHVDPIEKKPFFHFLPGAEAFSLGTAGCPFRCRFCQNWQLSQSRPEDNPPAFTPPGKVVEEAAARRAPVIAFTYNEPTVQTEFLTDVARAAKRAGIRSVIVSCGFMNEAPLREMCEVLGAVKIDLKGFSPEFYRDVSRAELAPVLRSIRQAAGSGVHLEIVNLVVPTLNDSEAMLRALADWVAGEVGPDVPVHFTRFHPDYQLRNLPPTPVATLEKAREIAMKKGIRYAYVGNVPGHPGNHTYCPGCGKVVVGRSGFFVTAMNLEKGRCNSCRRPVAGVWS
jgi:pyruvate formate lyase activating enzyme